MHKNLQALIDIVSGQPNIHYKHSSEKTYNDYGGLEHIDFYKTKNARKSSDWFCRVFTNWRLVIYAEPNSQCDYLDISVVESGIVGKIYGAIDIIKTLKRTPKVTDDDLKKLKESAEAVFKEQDEFQEKQLIKTVPEFKNKPTICRSSIFYKKQVLKLIPHGPYCYDSTGACPFWSKMEGYQKQENGYCSLMERGDWMQPENDGTFLLWDQCKACGINDDDDDDGEYEN